MKEGGEAGKKEWSIIGKSNKIFILIIIHLEKNSGEIKCGASGQINCQECSLMRSLIFWITKIINSKKRVDEENEKKKPFRKLNASPPRSSSYPQQTVAKVADDFWQNYPKCMEIRVGMNPNYFRMPSEMAFF